jgi:hypothetical protein
MNCSLQALGVIGAVCMYEAVNILQQSRIAFRVNDLNMQKSAVKLEHYNTGCELSQMPITIRALPFKQTIAYEDIEKYIEKQKFYASLLERFSLVSRAQCWHDKASSRNQE